MDRCYILWMMQLTTEQDRQELGDAVSFYQIGEYIYACSGYLTFLKWASGDETKITNLVGTISHLYSDGWQLFRQTVVSDPSMVVFYFERSMSSTPG